MQDKSDKLIILDLDETLIHATETELDRPYGLQGLTNILVYERPTLATVSYRHFKTLYNRNLEFCR